MRSLLPFRCLAVLLVAAVTASVCCCFAAPPEGGIVYQIFVRSFRDAVPDAEGVGDLKGVTQQLDPYLNDGKPETDHDLEVGILWLMPIHPASSYHGYDVTNFTDVNPEYGTLADFKELADAAHDRGVRVILDVPFNHASKRHPWFKEAIDDPASPYRDYFHIRGFDPTLGESWHEATNATGTKLSYLGAFNGYLPDFNFDNPKVRQYAKEVAKFWLDNGADGFRLDAAKHIYGDRMSSISENEILKNGDWWAEFADAAHQVKPDVILIGEVLGSRELLRRHAYGPDGLLDEPFMEDLRNQAAWPNAGFLERHRSFRDAARAVNAMSYPAGASYPDQSFNPFLFAASHDKSPRLASHFAELKRNGMPQSVDEAYRQTMHVLLTLDRHAILYQGDEVMQAGFKWNGNPPNHAQAPGDGSNVFDETLREPFQWYADGDDAGQTKWFSPRYDKPNDGISVEEQNADGQMLHLVRGLLNLRTEQPALAKGDITAAASDTTEWLVFERGEGAERCLVLINTSGNGNAYRFHDTWYPGYKNAQLLFWSDGQQRQWKNVTSDDTHIGEDVYVPPYGLVVLKKG